MCFPTLCRLNKQAQFRNGQQQRAHAHQLLLRNEQRAKMTNNSNNNQSRNTNLRAQLPHRRRDSLKHRNDLRMQLLQLQQRARALRHQRQQPQQQRQQRRQRPRDRPATENTLLRLQQILVDTDQLRQDKHNHNRKRT